MSKFESKCGLYNECDSCVRRESDYCFWCHLAEAYLAPAQTDDEL